MADWVVSGAAIILLAAAVQGSVGFGFGIVSLPVLAITMPERMPQVLILLGLASSIWVFARDRADVEWHTAAWLAPGRALGAVPGALFVALASPTTLDLAFGVVGGLAVWSVRRPVSGGPRARVAIVSAGFTAGAMGTATGVGGPPLLHALGHLSGRHQRSTASVVFIIGNAVSLVSLLYVGRFTRDDLVVGGLLMPALVLGAWLSGPVSRRLADTYVRMSIIVMGAAASALVLYRGLSGLLAG